MALIRNAKGRNAGSGYSRLFGDNTLGYLMSRVHSAVVTSGTELEKIIKKNVSPIDDLDSFLQQEIMPEGVFVADKGKVKKCKTLDFAGSEPDFIIFKRRQGKQQCYLVELKDGDSFDTKKAAAEHSSMHSFISKNAKYLQYKVSSHFCCFNQDNKQSIIDGFKKKIAPEEAMTGREFCQLLELDYEEIVENRRKQSPDNLDYFLSELIKIDSVKFWLEKNLGPR